MSSNAWKEVKGFPEYKINAKGEVRSFHPRWFKTFKDGKPIASVKGTRGYLVVRLRGYGAAKTCYVHRLVAEAFLTNPAGYAQVNHLDGDKLNNHVSNLSWCSHSQNMRHAYAIHLLEPYTGKRYKLNEDQVRDIKAQLKKGVSQKLIAAQFGVVRTQITNINSGLCWGEVRP